VANKMKKLFFSTWLSIIPFYCFAQSSFGVEGSLGFGRSGGELVNSLLLDGRLTLNENLSSSLGIGLWDSSYKKVWKEGDETNFTVFHLIDSKALPTIQFGVKGQFKILEIRNYPISLFAEPKLYFLPFSSRTSNLKEEYYTIDPVESANSGVNVYKRTGTSRYEYETENNPKLSYGIQAGISTILDKTMFLSIGLGYTNLDFYKELRGITLHSTSLNNHLPKQGLTTLFISMSYIISKN
jgi:hypothetical protein